MLDPRAPGADYALRWPMPTFRREVRRLTERFDPDDRTQVANAARLLEDAFAGETPVQDFTAATTTKVLTARRAVVQSAGRPITGWQAALHDVAAMSAPAQLEFLRMLDQAAPALPRHHEPAYWTQRRADLPTHAAADVEHDTPLDALANPAVPVLWRQWRALVEDLAWRGYLTKTAPPPCSREDPQSPPSDYWLERELADRLGADNLWPLEPRTWTEHRFYDLIEVVHDLVAWPRRRSTHRRPKHAAWDCWHYEDFTLDTGREVYRHATNQLLARHHAPVGLANDGDDVGRLVRLTGDDRDQLIGSALQSPDPAARGTIENAVRQFRSRTATQEDKRLAVVALAGLLEERERLLRPAGLLKNDESDLFRIANNFNLRHRNAKQQADYSEDFLDWLFWWYLATIELTDRLLARTPPAPPSAVTP